MGEFFGGGVEVDIETGPTIVTQMGYEGRTEGCLGM
jgi:hypothetical protein